MAEIKKGILGGFSGKVGTVVGVNWRGKNIIRSLPSASKKPPSENQLLQRIKFKEVARFLQPLRGIITRYFGNKTELKSRYNLATSYTLINALEVDDFIVTIRYDRVLVSKGELIGFQQIALDATAATLFSITWDNNSSLGNASATDAVTFVGYCATQDNFLIVEDIATRKDLSATIDMPEVWANEEIEVWMFLSNEKQSQASTSIYLGKHTVVWV